MTVTNRGPGEQAVRAEPAGGRSPLIDWRRTGRRVGFTAAALVLAAVLLWVVVGIATGGPDPADLPAFVGLALGGMFVAEVVVVGGAAVRGMLRAGERGERLSGGDVSLLPPQARRRRR